jgi:hypothetical protein
MRPYYMVFLLIEVPVVVDTGVTFAATAASSIVASVAAA